MIPKKKEIILIQQFRAGVISRYDEDYLFEIVAGDKYETDYCGKFIFFNFSDAA